MISNSVESTWFLCLRVLFLIYIVQFVLLIRILYYTFVLIYLWYFLIFMLWNLACWISSFWLLGNWGLKMAFSTTTFRHFSFPPFQQEPPQTDFFKILLNTLPINTFRCKKLATNISGQSNVTRPQMKSWAALLFCCTRGNWRSIIIQIINLFT